MSDEVSINLDKILVKLVCTAKIAEKKNQIAWLEENIKKDNEALADLQKQNESSKKHCDAWKPTYAILKEHGEYLKTEIKVLEEATESERFSNFYGNCFWVPLPICLEQMIKDPIYCLVLIAAGFAQSFKETKEDQNNSENIEGKNQKSLEKPEKFKERVFEEREHPSLPKEKHQLYKTLHVPRIPWKFVQSVQSFRSSKQRPETGRGEKEKPTELSVQASSSSSSLAENLSQIVIDTAGTNHPQIAQVPSRVSIKKQEKFRLSDLPKQLTSNQKFESENAVMASQEAKRADEEAHEHMDCSYVPQRAWICIQNLGCEEGTSKSPAFFSHMNFSQKSPGFNLFGSSLFGAQNSSDETEENYSVGNLNPLSPHEDIGSFFGKPENEDAFAFPFPSESTSHAFGDGKDDVSFSFAFGQDQRSSQSPSTKGFHSSTQNTKPFTFF
ncbi:hypothetical protein DV515_00001851 [Chloebia gouldiae]|uniref:Protein SIX6OS1 n=1 Tax=Chloebia gouldiae TaxID=44316 RepID=A0A3L8SXJ3_CHLGU|nr:hypothetical protein DV515_00001851 [Chloebia gouldiae]